MSQAGSYQAVVGEVDRLQRQAGALWCRERDAMRALGLAPGQRVLDVGCGSGAILRPLSQELRPKLAVGVDLDLGHLRHARVAGSVVRAHGAVLPFPDGSFDFVLLRLVLRHTPAPERLLAEAVRVARPGGVICANDVDESVTTLDGAPESWSGLKAALVRSAQRRGGDPFVGRRLKRLLFEAGLQSPQTAMFPVSTDDIAAPAWMDIVLAPGAREVDPDLMSPRSLADAWSAMRAWAARPEAFGFAVGVVAAARRQAS